MKKYLLGLALVFGLASNSNAQLQGSDIGVDGFFGASSFGGSFGLGVKYGLKFGDYFIAGPSARYQRSWNSNAVTGVGGGFNVYGGGAFFHARFINALFAGAEFEMLNAPQLSGVIGTGTRWAPTLLVGGGYSQEFNEKIRVQVGIMYDVIDNANSPFRQGYFLRRSNGSLIPVVYRISFFFPIG